MAHPNLLDRTQSALIVIDVQEAFRGVTFDHDRMLRGVCRLIEASKLLSIPILATEQYPKGLGHLLREVLEVCPTGLPVIEKRSMSCCGQPEFVAALNALRRTQVVVCGVESHACVSQTVHDLLGEGYRVHVPLDAISSRSEQDHRVACEKMIASGAVPTTVEMACLEWVKTADAPEFKSIQKLIK
jgi:nicotinamidase-related amidase